jgi:hypothetical protein
MVFFILVNLPVTVDQALNTAFFAAVNLSENHDLTFEKVFEIPDQIFEKKFLTLDHAF